MLTVYTGYKINDGFQAGHGSPPDKCQLDKMMSTAIAAANSSTMPESRSRASTSLDREFAWDIPSPPQFDDASEYRAYLKGRFALAFRIFAKLGFDEGVAGHITVKVRPTDWVAD